jgi:uncharacterized protein YndB with AHSA1/START domain
MSLFRRILLLLFSLLVLVIVVGMMCPAKVRVDRSLVIGAPPDRVYAQVVDFHRWPQWSPWYAMEPTADYSYSGAEQGVGAVMQWRGEQVGEGRQSILAAEPSRSIRTSLEFGRQGDAEANWTFDAVPEGTRVTWGFDADMGWNPISRLMGLMMDRWLGPDYERGLANLKTVCETAP